MGTKKLSSLHGNIIVEIHSKEETRASGIVIPGNVSRPVECGTVLSVSDGRVTEKGEKIEHKLIHGDIVYFRPDHAVYIGKTYCVLDERSVLAFVDDEYGAEIDM